MSRPTIPLASPIIGIQEYVNVFRVLRSGMLAQGTQVAKLEFEFSNILSGRSCVAVNSGTSGLVTALLAIGVRAGDEVLVPSFTFAATANAVALIGATPIFVDIDTKTYNLDINDVKAKVTRKTKVIMPVHLFGLCANMQEILDLARQHDLKIVEDASQAHLASIDGVQAGTFGDAAVFSFYATKNMTTGEGGMISFKSEEHARIARMVRNQGMEKKYQNEIVGFNFRMTDIQAAIGLAQLKKLSKWTDRRIENAAVLFERIRVENLPLVQVGYKHVFHQFTIRVKTNRDEFIHKLKNSGVESGVYYPTPVHLLPAFNSGLRLKATESASAEVLSLPVHPSLKKSDLKRIADSVNRAWESQ